MDPLEQTDRLSLSRRLQKTLWLLVAVRLSHIHVADMAGACPLVVDVREERHLEDPLTHRLAAADVSLGDRCLFLRVNEAEDRLVDCHLIVLND